MALTKISTGGVKDDAVTAGKIPADAVGQSEIADEAVDEARLQVSNAGTNGQFLSKQSGNTGGLTWADVPAAVGGSNGVDFSDNTKIRLGTGNDLAIYHDATAGHTKIDEHGTGILSFSASGINILNETRGTLSVDIAPNTGVSAYYGGQKKIETVNTGVTITGVCTATSFVGDGSTLTNLPAGGNSFEAVAEGAIAANNPVYLSTVNGKVKQPSESTSTLAAVSVHQTTTHGNNDSRNEAFISIGGDHAFFAYKHGGSGDDGFGRYCYWNNDENFIMGSAVNFSGTGNPSVEHICAVYDSTADKIGMVYRNGSGHDKPLQYQVAQRSGTSITYGTKSQFQASTGTNNDEYGDIHGAFDPDNRRITFVYVRTGQKSFYSKTMQISTSSNTASVGSQSSFVTNQGGTKGIDICYDTNVNRYCVVLCYKDPSNNYKIRAYVGNPNGNAVTWGDALQFNLTDSGSPWVASAPRVCFDPDSNLVLCVVRDETNGGAKQYPFRLTGGSTNTVALADTNSPTTVASDVGTAGIDLGYDVLANRMILSYASSSNSNRPSIRLGTYSENYSGTNDYYTWGSATQLHSSGVGNGSTYANSDGTRTPLVIHPSGGKGTFYFHPGYPQSQTSCTFKTTSTTSDIPNHHYVGFPDAAYTDGQTVTIKTEGNTVGGFSGLTPFGNVYGSTQNTVTTSNGGGALSYQNLGKALNATTLQVKVPYLDDI